MVEASSYYDEFVECNTAASVVGEVEVQVVQVGGRSEWDMHGLQAAVVPLDECLELPYWDHHLAVYGHVLHPCMALHHDPWVLVVGDMLPAVQVD